MIERYEQLLALVEREHALAVAGAWEELAAIDALRRELAARLPAVPPPAAASVLSRGAETQARTSALLAGGVEALRRELGALSQGRAAVRGYGVAAGAGAARAPARLDLAG